MTHTDPADLDLDPADPLPVRIVQAIAHVDGVEPHQLEFRLMDVIDADALTALDQHGGTYWELTFETPDHQVTVDREGTVVVDGIEFE